ncbi:aryl-sulfate sulfotransferase [Burkholderia pseudomultivorans]|uniref:ribbon-helix-helix domain-containing protein n=1 Tax=Burkholderia pseudomultivorans TaxID=1207504 RepID=UPI00075C11C4|nr:ribbon-helix-helix domain-containing protein [Burkholderia pseudomultivorans]KVC34631.1 aryl-sulfate sulfotransferase [Burkholderia pseudomultivorans]KVC35219.1 aryl-sulfate sulfotransferase [Burkholderia pseudomultivorans]KVC40628.1 aryl-sulfate sulfotransferase [Burkholderia pseudomultivorans]
MCEVLVNADPMLYESRTRSLRIRGVVTTVRMENLFWDVLHEIAQREKMTTSQFAVKLYEELLDLRGEPPANFTSFLRVCCLRYLSRDIVLEDTASQGSQKTFRPKIVHGT